MKNIIGFADTEKEQIEKETMAVAEEAAEETPVRSLVKIHFASRNQTLDYYNDLFDLKEGDRVFVTGKLSGVCGRVISVSTKFRIKLSDYQKVISKADMKIGGTFKSIFDKMVSFDEGALPPERFRTWVLPPKDENEEIICGDGFEVDLENFERNEDIDHGVLARGVELCDKAAYINVTNGKGIAYVHGTRWYEITFNIDGCKVSDISCDCPYPYFCKHTVALLVILRAFYHQEGFGAKGSFTAIDRDLFWQSVAEIKGSITL